MKTYVLIISNNFPKTHSRSGDETNFISKIATGEKLHTIRGNYDLWRKRFDLVEQGLARISVRFWTGLPRRSKQKEVFSYTIENGIGLEKLEYGITDCPDIAKNDGLSKEDFKEWFKKTDTTKPMAIIHFSSFRYLS